MNNKLYPRFYSEEVDLPAISLGTCDYSVHTGTDSLLHGTGPHGPSGTGGRKTLFHSAHIHAPEKI